MKVRIVVSEDLAECCVKDLKFHVLFRAENNAAPKPGHEFTCLKCGTVMLMLGTGQWVLKVKSALPDDVVLGYPEVFLCIGQDRESGEYFVGEVTEKGTKVESLGELHGRIEDCRAAAIEVGKERQLAVVGLRGGEGGVSIYLWKPEPVEA